VASVNVNTASPALSVVTWPGEMVDEPPDAVRLTDFPLTGFPLPDAK
jgi:hypothetical protein